MITSRPWKFPYIQARCVYANEIGILVPELAAGVKQDVAEGLVAYVHQGADTHTPMIPSPHLTSDW
jgi:hypothetical protein